MYDLDIYTFDGTIIPNECQSIEDVINILREVIDVAQLINITKV